MKKGTEEEVEAYMKAENARISAVTICICHYISIHIRSAMQYKTSFFSDDTWPVFVFI